MSAPSPRRYRVSRARLTFPFERYAIGAEVMSVDDAARRLSVPRETIALHVLRGRLAIVEAVRERPDQVVQRMVLTSEVDALAAYAAVAVPQPSRQARSVSRARG